MKYILYLLIGMLVLACDDFLSKEPTKSSAQKVETLDDLEAILNEPSTHHLLRGAVVNFFCTDNTELPLEVFKEYKGNFYIYQVQQYLWEAAVDVRTDSYWNACYAAIWNANLIINMVDGMEGDETRKENIRAEAYAMRAYKYFMLAQTYCLHYTAATADEPGLPLRKRTDFEENLDRSTLEETYRLIDADLQEALKLTVSFADKRWRASRASVNAFAARYYLYRGNYTEAEKCANMALGEFSELVDYTTISRYLYRTYSVPTSDGQISLFPVYYPDTYKYTSKQELEWKEQYQTEIENEASYLILPSTELLNLYKEYPHDLRYELFMVEGYMDYYGVNEHAWYGYVILGSGKVYTGPSVAEMYLIRAECKARNNDISGCMSDLEIVREKRFASENYLVLPMPKNRKEAVQIVLDERRREAPFALRWMDLRRLTSDELMDPIVVKRTFWPLDGGDVNMKAGVQEYILSPESRKYARPIGSDAINLSNGQTKQNQY